MQVIELKRMWARYAFGLLSAMAVGLIFTTLWGKADQDASKPRNTAEAINTKINRLPVLAHTLAHPAAVGTHQPLSRIGGQLKTPSGLSLFPQTGEATPVDPGRPIGAGVPIEGQEILKAESARDILVIGAPGAGLVPDRSLMTEGPLGAASPAKAPHHLPMPPSISAQSSEWPLVAGTPVKGMIILPSKMPEK